jgi:hypothetical protein
LGGKVKETIPGIGVQVVTVSGGQAKEKAKAYVVREIGKIANAASAATKYEQMKDVAIESAAILTIANNGVIDLTAAQKAEVSNVLQKADRLFSPIASNAPTSKKEEERR